MNNGYRVECILYGEPLKLRWFKVLLNNIISGLTKIAGTFVIHI